MPPHQDFQKALGGKKVKGKKGCFEAESLLGKLWATGINRMWSLPSKKADSGDSYP